VGGECNRSVRRKERKQELSLFSVFRIGHMGDLNEPMPLGAIELALADAGMPHARGGLEAAMDALRAPAARMAEAA